MISRNKSIIICKSKKKNFTTELSMAISIHHFDEIPNVFGGDIDSFCPPPLESDYSRLIDLISNQEAAHKSNFIFKGAPTGLNLPNWGHGFEDEKITEEPSLGSLILAKTEMEIEPPDRETDEAKTDYFEVPQVNTIALRSLIDKALRGFESTFQELKELNEIEKIILQSIIEKKSFQHEEKVNKGKRVEEKQKLFFKAALKYSENKYFRSVINDSKKKIKKRELDQREFYESYFGESAKKNKCNLSNFFHPNKKLKSVSNKSTCTLDDKGRAGLKSLNSTYIDLILSSERFRNDCIEFLEYCFVQDYQKTRYHKIEKLLKQITKVVESAWMAYNSSQLSNKNFSKDQSLKEFVNSKVKEHILSNSKSKLPWSNTELDEAKLFARQRINKARSVLDSNF